MAMDPEKDRRLMQRGRRAALVIVGAMLFWLGALYVGREMGWDQRLALVFDLVALVALAYAVWMAFGIYRVRRAEKD